METQQQLKAYEATLAKEGILYLPCKIIPKSPQTEIIGVFEGVEQQPTLKIRIKSPPEKGKANAELIACLAKRFGVPQQNISILSGKTERNKLLKIKAN